jgi:HEAT repeat protein
MTLQEAAQQADELAAAGDQRGLATLRQQWDEELEHAARNADYRVRAQAYRAIAQFRFRQKLELVRRGLQDESPAARGSALIALEALSRDHPGDVNAMRALLHELASNDSNVAVRRLAIVCLKNGSPARETIVILRGLAETDDEERQLRDTAQKVAAFLTKKSNVEASARRSGGR